LRKKREVISRLEEGARDIKTDFVLSPIEMMLTSPTTRPACPALSDSPSRSPSYHLTSFVGGERFTIVDVEFDTGIEDFCFCGHTKNCGGYADLYTWFSRKDAVWSLVGFRLCFEAALMTYRDVSHAMKEYAVLRAEENARKRIELLANQYKSLDAGAW
jgi:hypothetical protein